MECNLWYSIFAPITCNPQPRMQKFKFLKSEYRRPPAALKHVELSLDFFDDHVDGRETLSFRAEEALDRITLDAQELDVKNVALAGKKIVPLTSVYIKEENKLTVFLPRAYKKGEKFALQIAATCVPSHTNLFGIYHDTTPPGDHPPQFFSQCQQWGFQRIMPILDDCTAKALWRTTLEADARYTHLITNGDLVSDTLAADGKRRRVVYENNVPMPSYLFLVTAGTYDELADAVTLPSGKTLTLKYLVPPGRTDGARLPMEILKDAVVWQARRLDFEYKYDTYRTICMDKSVFGGMENAGNTAIITDGALADRWTSDGRLLFVHGVIIHEYEHSHCGGGVTMETPFDMWLNEAFTCNVDREYTSQKFGADNFRLGQIDGMRAPMRGALASEDGGEFGAIVRVGFNRFDDIVDGITYGKGAEVLEMLRNLIGSANYEKAVAYHFKKYAGANANTEQFIASFQKFSKRDLKPYFDGWLHGGGYPSVSCSWKYSPKTKTLAVAVSQLRHGGGAAVMRKRKNNPFVIPFRFTACDPSGKKLVSEHVVLEQRKHKFVIENVAEKPAFIDWNSGEAFYGVIQESSADPEALFAAARFSPNIIGRVEAKRRLDDIEMAKEIANAQTRKHANSCDENWLDLHAEILADPTLPPEIKARMITVSEEMLDRAYLPLAAERNTAARKLRTAIARRIGEKALLEPRNGVVIPEPLPQAINRRTLTGVLAQHLGSLATPAAIRALEKLFDEAQTITDNINAALALNLTTSPTREKIMRKFSALASEHQSAYADYLRVLSSRPDKTVFADVAAEEKNPRFKIEHPGHCRALFHTIAANNAVLWTPEGIRWSEKTILKLLKVNENLALGFISAFMLSASKPAPLRDKLLAMLRRIAPKIPASAASLRSKIELTIGMNA